MVEATSSSPSSGDGHPSGLTHLGRSLSGSASGRATEHWYHCELTAQNCCLHLMSPDLVLEGQDWMLVPRPRLCPADTPLSSCRAARDVAPTPGPASEHAAILHTHLLPHDERQTAHHPPADGDFLSSPSDKKPSCKVRRGSFPPQAATAFSATS